MTFLLLLGLGVFAWYLMKPEEREKVLPTLRLLLARVHRETTRWGAGQESFTAALRARTRFAPVTFAIAAISIAIWLRMFTDAGAIADPATLLAWGASSGPATTNGEWGRLVTSLFVHSGPLHILVNLVALVQLGVILERMVGHFAFTTVYLAAGVVAGVVNLYESPVAVTAGASGAVWGLVGLLAAVAFRGWRTRSPVTIPLRAGRTLGPLAAVFVLYSVADTSLVAAAEGTAAAVGCAGGLLLARDVAARKPPMRITMASAFAAAVIVLAAALPLRGIVDVKAELEELVALEGTLTSGYQKKVQQFRLGRVTTAQLAETIDDAIRPGLRAARARVEGLAKVPSEQQALVSAARDYLRLREEGWRLRAEALRRQSKQMPALREADRLEHASLRALSTIEAALEGRPPRG